MPRLNEIDSRATVHTIASLSEDSLRTLPRSSFGQTAILRGRMSCFLNLRNIYSCLYECVFAHGEVHRREDALRGQRCWTHRSWTYKFLWTTWCGCYEPNWWSFIGAARPHNHWAMPTFLSTSDSSVSSCYYSSCWVWMFIVILSF